MEYGRDRCPDMPRSESIADGATAGSGVLVLSARGGVARKLSLSLKLHALGRVTCYHLR